MQNLREFVWVVKASMKVRNREGESDVLYGGAICVAESGLLVTSVTALTTMRKPSRGDFDRIKVTVRNFGRRFVGAKIDMTSVETGLVLLRIKNAQGRRFEAFEWRNQEKTVRELDFPVLTKFLAFVHTGGGFSFKRGVNNSSTATEFPNLAPRTLSLVQLSGFGRFLNTGMAGCPVFRLEGKELLGLIFKVSGQFSFVVPVRYIESLVEAFLAGLGGGGDAGASSGGGGGRPRGGGGGGGGGRPRGGGGGRPGGGGGGGGGRPRGGGGGGGGGGKGGGGGGGGGRPGGGGGGGGGRPGSGGGGGGGRPKGGGGGGGGRPRGGGGGPRGGGWRQGWGWWWWRGWTTNLEILKPMFVKESNFEIAHLWNKAVDKIFWDCDCLPQFT